MTSAAQIRQPVMSRRRMIGLVGGGAVLAAVLPLGLVATRSTRTATRPWAAAGLETEPRRRALSFALLTANPHNRQPWLVDLAEPGVVTLYADQTRLLPHTDPYNRQITLGLGGFLELMRMAAADNGYRVETVLFPEGESETLDTRPIARSTFTADASVALDPLFAHVANRRTNKEPFDTGRPVAEADLAPLAAAGRATRFGGSVAEADITALRALSREALRIETETPRTFRESVDLFRIGRTEVDANPDGIDFTGPMFEVMHATGLFTREAALDVTSQAYKAGLDAVYANADTAMGHVWQVSAGNTRADQIGAGADWLRLNLAATGAGIAVQPLSQALQEYPEMAGLYREIHAKLAPEGGIVQMFARVGYGPAIGQSPRWPLQSRIVNA